MTTSIDESLILCAACGEFVRGLDTRCPFCGAGHAAPIAAPSRGLAGVVMTSVRASLAALALCAVGCSAEPGTATDGATTADSGCLSVESTGVGGATYRCGDVSSTATAAFYAGVPTTYCGDGVVSDGEECDPAAPSAISCGDAAGTPVACTADCTIDLSPCEAGCAKTFNVMPMPARAEHTQTGVVVTPGFCVDTFEVSVSSYKNCVNVGDCAPPPTGAQQGAFNYAEAGREAHPMNGVTQAEAAAYCAASGKSLPNDAQWSTISDVVASSGEFSASELCALGVWGGVADATGQLACPQATGTQPIGTGAAITDGAGDSLSDAVGNVAEWIADGSIVGGAYNDPADKSAWTLDALSKTSPVDARSPAIGFRCVQ